MLRVVLTHEHSVYGAVGIKDDAIRKRLIRGAPWSTLGCHEPLDDGCGGGGRKAVIPWGASFLFFFQQSVRKEVWVEVPKGTKHPPVLLEVLIGVGREYL